MSFCTRFVLHNSLASTLSIASFSSFDDDYVERHLHVSKKNISDNWSHVSQTSLCMLTLSDVLLGPMMGVKMCTAGNFCLLIVMAVCALDRGKVLYIYIYIYIHITIRQTNH